MKYLIFLPLLLAGCAVTPTQQSFAVTETRAAADVAGCKFIGPVIDQRTGASGDAALKYARVGGLNTAAAQGATHVYWRAFKQWGDQGRAEGDAYACAK